MIIPSKLKGAENGKYKSEIDEVELITYKPTDLPGSGKPIFLEPAKRLAKVSSEKNCQAINQYHLVAET